MMRALRVLSMIIVGIVVGIASQANAQTTLGIGDVVFTGYQSDDPDTVTFVLLVPTTTGTSLTMTDNGWFAAGGFRATEGTATWTSAADLPKNTQVTIETWSLVSNDAGVTAGSVATSGSIALATGGDQIFAYQGAAPVAGDESNFVAAMQMNGPWDSDATSSNTSALPSVFTDGVNSLAIDPEIDNAVYNCDNGSDGTPAELLSWITNAANWSTSNDLGLVQPPCQLLPVELVSLSVE